jgi:3-deoxy-7-phosphoheptulonate synthase
MESRNQEDVDRVVAKIEEFGYQPHLIYGVERTVIGAVGDERGKSRLQSLESMPGVEKVVPILKPFKLAGRELHAEDSSFKVGNVVVGGGTFRVFAGPCSVESRDQILESARCVKESGGHVLRGGAYKPRTSPYAFQGLEEDGLKLLKEASEETGLPFVTEVLTPEKVPLVAEYADMLQIGARNIQNFGLLKEVGQTDKPVFLKRGMMSTINETLMSAEYVLSEGNPNVAICERGIRTFETETRNTLDISAVPVLKKLSHLPVIVDPSHAAGQWEYIESLTKAAVAAGADGVMVEMHPHPEDAFSDGPQSLKPKRFDALMKTIEPYVKLAGKSL